MTNSSAKVTFEKPKQLYVCYTLASSNQWQTEEIRRWLPVEWQVRVGSLITLGSDKYYRVVAVGATVITKEDLVRYNALFPVSYQTATSINILERPQGAEA